MFFYHFIILLTYLEHVPIQRAVNAMSYLKTRVFAILTRCPEMKQLKWGQAKNAEALSEMSENFPYGEKDLKST